MSEKFFAESRQTLALAIPIMAGQVSQMVMGLIDSAMVGRIGVTPLAASSFANTVISIPFIFGVGLLICLSVRVAQSHGAGEHEESGENLRHGIALALLAGAVLTGLVWVLSFYLNRFGQDADVAREARPFMLLLGWSIIPAMVGLGFKQFSEALGNAWPPTLIFLAAVPLNAFFNWLLIYGNWGFPALGLTGAGWGTLLSRITACLLIIIYVLRDKKIHRSLPAYWGKSLQIERIRSLLAIGIPASLQILLEVGAFSVGAILVGQIGKNALAAHQIALSTISTIFMLPLGLSMATTIRIGQALGSQELTRVRAIGYSSFGVSLLVMATMATFLSLFGRVVANAFVNDAEVALLASRLLVVAAVFQLVDGLQVVAAGALRGLSDVTVPMLVCFLAYWVVGLPTGYFLSFTQQWGAVGIWCGFALGLALSAFGLSWRFTLKSRVEALAHFEVSERPVITAH